MAIGGALRAAIKAGNFVKVASESRRRARALAELNASGGISSRTLNPRRSKGIPNDLEEMGPAGYPVRSYYSPSTGIEWDDIGLLGDGRSMRGNELTRFGDGTNVVFPPNPLRGARVPRAGMRPIEAPYEGFRTFPQWGLNDPSPFMGRGRAPSFNNVPEPRYYDQGTDIYSEPFIFDPLRANSFMNVPRAFGGNPGMGPAPRKRSPVPGGRPRIFFDDFSY